MERELSPRFVAGISCVPEDPAAWRARFALWAGGVELTDYRIYPPDADGAIEVFVDLERAEQADVLSRACSAELAVGCAQVWYLGCFAKAASVRPSA